LEELRIELTYGTIFAVTLLSLEFILGSLSIPLGVIALIQIGLFFAIARNEDKITIKLSMGYLLVN
jgi:hypothetical protein